MHLKGQGSVAEADVVDIGVVVDVVVLPHLVGRGHPRLVGGLHGAAQVCGDVGAYTMGAAEDNLRAVVIVEGGVDLGGPLRLVALEKNALRGSCGLAAEGGEVRLSAAGSPVSARGCPVVQFKREVGICGRGVLEDVPAYLR